MMGKLLAGLAGAAALAAVLAVHAAGQTLLALTLLLISVLALWTYTSCRSGAWRYLFPGIAAALVFVIFPMLYTIGMGFTNHSAQNLLDEDRARAYLLEEAVQLPGSARPFTLHAEGAAWRIRLGPAEGTAPAASPASAVDAGAPAQQEAWLSPPLALPPDAGQATESSTMASTTASDAAAAAPLRLSPMAAGVGLASAAPLREVVALLPALRALRLQPPGGPSEAPPLTLAGLGRFAQHQALYQPLPGGALQDRLTGVRYAPDAQEGFFTSAEGDRLTPGYRVAVGLRHYARIFTEPRFREPFVSVFGWTVAFAGLSVLGAGGLGLLLAVLLNWEPLQGKGLYRLVLFLPYAVPGFISILIFKGLFNQNLGEVNLVLHGLFGIRPAWFSDPLLARAMLLIVNVWLGFPYMMVLCSGLIKAIPADLYEASAVLGATPWANFRHVTAPLILKPLTPLLISAFAFNFNNFVLISLLTGGRPDQVDVSLPAGTTDILVSYTWRIAFQDSGQQFGLAAALSTVIFVIVAAITLVQMRLTRLADDGARR